MTHKTDVPKTSDLAGFAAREAGQVPRVNADLVDPIRRSQEAGQVLDGWYVADRPADSCTIATGDRVQCKRCGHHKAYLHQSTDMLECVQCGRWLLDEDDRFLTSEKAQGPRVQPTPERIAAMIEEGKEVWVDADKAREAGQGWDLGYNKPDGDNDMKIKFVDDPTPYIDAEQLKESTRKAVLTPIDQTLFERKAREFQEEHPVFRPRERTTADDITDVCNDIRDMLLAKNRKYGDSALDPVRVFSRATPVEQILVRLDDKLSRLRSAQADEDEDVVDDLIGYLVLLKIARSR